MRKITFKCCMLHAIMNSCIHEKLMHMQEFWKYSVLLFEQTTNIGIGSKNSKKATIQINFI